MQLQYTAIALYDILKPEQAIVKTVKTYSTRAEADLARIALDAAGVPSVIVGIEAAFEGGAGGVHLLVPDEYVEAALDRLLLAVQRKSAKVSFSCLNARIEFGSLRGRSDALLRLL